MAMVFENKQKKCIFSAKLGHFFLKNDPTCRKTRSKMRPKTKNKIQWGPKSDPSKPGLFEDWILNARHFLTIQKPDILSGF